MSEMVEVIHGDCLEVMAGMAAGSVDAIVTDPPYLTGEAKIPQNHSYIGKVYNPSESIGLPWGYSLDWIEVAARLCPAHWVVFANFKMLGGLCTALARHAEISAVFVWRKSNAPRMARPVPRLDCEFIVWARRKDVDCGRMKDFDSLVIDVPMPQAGCFPGERLTLPGSGKAVHPCQKPLAVVLPFVSRLFHEPGWMFLDPFAGTGTTGVACLKSGHRCMLVEKDARYIPFIHRRLSDATTPLLDGLAPPGSVGVLGQEPGGNL